MQNCAACIEKTNNLVEILVEQRDECASKLVESVPSASTNSDYTAALRVWHEYTLHCRKYGLDSGSDFPRWVQSLNSAKAPNCAQSQALVAIVKSKKDYTIELEEAVSVRHGLD